MPCMKNEKLCKNQNLLLKQKQKVKVNGLLRKKWDFVIIGNLRVSINFYLSGS